MGKKARRKIESRANAPREPEAGRFRTPYLLLVALAVLPYLNTLDAPFLYDDNMYVVDNPQVRDPRAIGAMLKSSYPPMHASQGLYRPLVTLSYAVDFAVWKLEPTGFHLTNVLLHALATLAGFVFLRQLAAENAAAAAMIFAVHPVHAEAVSWIVGRAEILCALLLFLGLSVPLLAVSAILVALALLAKEMAVTAPMLELLLAFVPSRLPRAWRRAASFLAVVLGYLGLRAFVLGALTPQGSQRTLEGVGLLERIPAAFVCLAGDLRLLVFPLRLAVDYPWAQVPTWSDPAALVGVGLAALLLLVAFRSRDLRVPILWFLAALLPVSHLVPFGSTYADRFLYIPSLGICLGIAVLLRRLPRGLSVFALTLLLILGGVRTVLRNQDWRDEQRFYEKALAASPDNATLQSNLGHVLMEKAAKAQATERAALTARAEKLFAGAVKRNGRLAPALANLGVIRAQEGHLAEAKDLLERCVKADPTYARGFNNLGNVYAILGRRDDAREAYEKAIALSPGYADALENQRKLSLGKPSSDRR